MRTESRRVFVGERELVCTATEYAILELLMKNPDRIFPNACCMSLSRVRITCRRTTP